MGAWLDNLIPLKIPPLKEEQQLAGWQPKKPAREGLGCHLLADERIPVEGGVTLSADVYTPKVPGRYPAIVQFAAYSRELHTAGIPTGSNEIGSPPVFTNHGYAQVVVMRRGMGRSGGEGEVFLNPQDVDDHAACIAWAAAQPWCDGRVVLFGTSYYGMTQPLVAVKKPPALKAFFCNEICTDYFRQITQFGGVPGLYFCGLWMGGNFTKGSYDRRVPPVLRALVSHITNARFRWIWQRLLMKRIHEIFHALLRSTPILPVRRWYVNWLIDGKTRETSSIPPGPYAELDKIEVPFVVVQNLGYFNLHQFGCYDLFENAGTPADRKWMILAPPHYELPVYSWQLEAIAFFDHVLHGIENGYREQPPVRYWLEGTGRYAGAQDFPVPGSLVRRLYPASTGEDTAMHRLQPEAPEGGANRWVAVPLGAPLVGGFDEVANQMLSFEMTVDRPTQLAGPVSLHLSFSCNDIDSQVSARLGRVGTDGSFHLLSLGTVNAARRALDPVRSTSCEIAIDSQHPAPLTPGVPVQLAFSLTPAPTLLQPGERLRLDIASRISLLRSDASHGYVQFNIPGPPYFSRNTMHFGPETYLEVREVPA